jgi:hypothetical protein
MRVRGIIPTDDGPHPRVFQVWECPVARCEGQTVIEAGQVQVDDAARRHEDMRHAS